MPDQTRPHGKRADSRFVLHQRQPRADKLDGAQRRLCQTDPAFRDALRQRVASADRFSAFLGGLPSYVDFEKPCPQCGNFRRRTRDRSCYGCHLAKGKPNFDRMKEGIAPVVNRSRDGHLDQLERQRAEARGENMTRQFGQHTATRWPSGRLEITFPNGSRTSDLATDLSAKAIFQAAQKSPDLLAVLQWAGWY